ncbi:AraC family transcriptional regulator [Ruegeria sp. EL01]|jgi:AraC-like DNA-binding protein|uniref:helix-turn-helix domain-containing protein n=1 Tax=Ruegeria sp. EL01 TaxID=2107578 RepID=UPI0013C44345|nr:helix-turn-helix domain-containing protein [Ruegeria sp. EL01]
MQNVTQRPIVFPGFLREQFRNQFGDRLKDDLPKLSDLQSDFTLDEVFHYFDVADRKIGEHWPLLATNLWRYGAHQLWTTYTETSVNIVTALRDLFSKETAYLPVFSATYEPLAEGLIVRVRPTIEFKDRHWHILMTLLILGETAFYKWHLPEEAKLITYKTSLPKQSFSETFQKLTTANIEFDCPPDEGYALYPYSLIGQGVGVRNDRLNKVLLEEVHRTSQLPAATDQALLNLRKLASECLPAVLSIHQAASKLGISRSTLLRRLKQQKMSFRKVVLNARKEYVLIRLSNMDYGEHLAAELGFTSMRALSEFCRKNTGYTLKQLAKKSV